jgi:hypothetical protein
VHSKRSELKFACLTPMVPRNHLVMFPSLPPRKFIYYRFDKSNEGVPSLPQHPPCFPLGAAQPHRHKPTHAPPPHTTSPPRHPRCLHSPPYRAMTTTAPAAQPVSSTTTDNALSLSTLSAVGHGGDRDGDAAGPLLDLCVGSSRSSGTSSAAAAAAALTATPADAIVARRVVARWRAFVAQRKACPLFDMLETFPDLFLKEVLERLDPMACTMLAQVGKPWLAAVLASGLPRLPQGVMVRLRLRDFCTSAERLAWAKANGCPWWDGAT